MPIKASFKSSNEADTANEACDDPRDTSRCLTLTSLSVQATAGDNTERLLQAVLFSVACIAFWPSELCTLGRLDYIEMCDNDKNQGQ